MNELARQAGMDQGLLSKIERGLRPAPQIVPYVQRIAAALGLSDTSAEFKELAEAAYRDRFGRQKWPEIASLMLGPANEPVLTHRPIVPSGLGEYAPPETREVVKPHSPLGRLFGPQLREGKPVSEEVVFSPTTAIPPDLDEILSASAPGLWVKQMLDALASMDFVFTRIERQGDGFNLEFRFNGQEYTVTISPKLAPPAVS